ncbi:MAG: NADH-quinone oxidoreductase subunit NuoK [Verrucomicrobia bacterium]|nr:MAG: NADH-quinone oxidoreductase subunit NuoK [Verrucomicrobiota bacterium]
MHFQLSEFLAPALMLFVTGFAGAVLKKNAIIVFMCVELMLVGAMLALLSFAAANGDVNGGVYALFVMAIAAAEVAVGLAILVRLFRLRGVVDVRDMNSLGD